MARGWESKSVEAQQEASRTPGEKRAALSREEAARKSERATLMLARTRLLADLQAACAPAHRGMLEQAVTDIDGRIKLLDSQG